MKWNSVWEEIRRKPRSSWIRFVSEFVTDLLLVNVALLLTYLLIFDLEIPNSARQGLLLYSLILTPSSALSWLPDGFTASTRDTWDW